MTDQKESASGLSGGFPGQDFEAKLRAADEAENAAKVNLVSLTKKISTIEQNRGLLELDDRDPEAEIRALRLKVKTAEAAVQLSRQATLRILSGERQRHDEIKNGLWLQIHERVILPYVASLREARAQLHSAIANVLALIAAQADTATAAATDLSAAIRDFDAGTRDFNRIAGEFRAPGQVHVPENEFLRVQLLEALARHYRENLDLKNIGEALAAAGSPEAAKKYMNGNASGI